MNIGHLKNGMSNKIKILAAILTLLFLILGAAGYQVYRWVQQPNVGITTAKVIYIPTGSGLNDLVNVLDTAEILKRIHSFQKVAGWMSFGENEVLPGKYTIQPGWSNRELINLLRSGRQTPVNLVINNVRTLPDLAAKIALQVESDSLKIVRHLSDSLTWKKYDLSQETLMTLFIPNTYQVYWTDEPEAITDRLKNEHNRFWLTNNRNEKAKELNLTPQEVYTLASIVERETQAKSERPTVAGLYLNRLKNSIPLQADPTVVFATGIYDLRRVLIKHLEIESPFNTYKHRGLPPGPIYMPSIESLDAVLNAEDHNYLYMCARPDNSGLHAFAPNLTAHNINAARYRQWLNERGIK